jgi:uncharacterized repeat protein (TIGR01451 family)
MAAAILLLSGAALLPSFVNAQATGGGKQTGLIARAYERLANWFGRPSALTGTIGGVVYNDFNANGVRDNANETGVGGVTVTAYDAAGVAQGAANTLADGTYSLAATGAGPYRIEFTNLPAGYFTGPQGSNSKSTVQFTPDGNSANTDLGILYPSDYSQSVPEVAIPCYVNGDPTKPGTTAGADVLVSFPNNRAGTLHPNVCCPGLTWANTPPSNNPAPNHIASASQVGAVWGVAWQRYTKDLFVSALLRRHAGYGPLGSGGLYRTDYSGATPAVFNFLNVETIGIDTGGAVINNTTRNLPGDLAASNTDAAAYDGVGKHSLGDLELSDDGKTLYFINLFDQKLYALNITAAVNSNYAIVPTAADKQSFTVPSPGCSNGVFRPFGLKFNHGKLYVGGVCTAENAGGTAGDLRAAVYEFTPGTGFNPAPLVNFPLNYWRGLLYSTHWIPWFSSQPGGNPPTFPEPILSDLEFDENGNLLLGFVDRYGLQRGVNNVNPDGSFASYTIIAGELLRAVKSGATFSIEPTVNNAGSAFFYDNAFIGYPYFHSDATSGAMALRLGSGEIATTVMDPLRGWTGGTVWFDTTSGQPTRAYEIYFSEGNSTLPPNGTFQKAVGLGDLEMLFDPAPIEVGNRVWRDTNKNGVQDPGENPVAGVTVHLYSPTGALLATAVTDANGNYYFSNAAGTNTASTIFGIAGLTPDTNGFVIRLDKAGDYASGGPLFKLTLTLQDAGGVDTRDSDGAMVSGFPQTAFNTGAPGANNHSYDFGFIAASDLALAKTRAGDFCNGNVVSYTLAVRNDGPEITDSAITVVDTLPAGLTYLSATGAGWTCNAAGQTVTCTNPGPLAVNASSAATLNVAIGYSVTGIVTNSATVSYVGDPNPANNTASDKATVTSGIGAPGQSYPGSGSSVLIYPVYTSSASNPNTQNTKITLTNIHDKKPICVHLFFVDGSSCTVADNYVCLTANQTLTFLASDLDPGTTGYLVALAVDCATGCPVNFNFLVGDEHAKFATGHAANLAAQGVPALPALATCNDQSVTAALNFDGVSYGLLPRALALSNIPSKADGNDTLLILNRIGGRLDTGAVTLNSIFGILYDDAETAFSFSFSPGTCQFRASLSNNFPRTAPRFESALPAGRSGWLKLWSQNDQALVGAAINFNGNAASNSTAYNQGHGLHTLTRTAGASLTIPVFPPSC